MATPSKITDAQGQFWRSAPETAQAQLLRSTLATARPHGHSRRRRTGTKTDITVELYWAATRRLEMMVRWPINESGLAQFNFL